MPQRKLLIVEDDFILYDELCEFFEEKGFSIIKSKNEGAAVSSYDEAVQLMKQQKPDIALLDIRIDGDKDGIDLGNYIRQHYFIPVVYLSAYPNEEYKKRIQKGRGKSFVFKTGKPLDKSQLEITFDLALEDIDQEDIDETVGRFFSVKEMKLSKSNSRPPQTVIKDTDPLEIETFVQWEEILYIESYNATTAGKGHNNSILMQTSQPEKAYILRSTMDDIEEQLPNNFIRFNQSIIVNFRKVTSKMKSTHVYFVGELSFKVSDVYKARALDKINRLLGKNGKNDFPK